MAPDINPSIPIVGQPNSSEEPKVVTALTQLVAAVNDVDSAQIQDLSVTNADIANATLTNAKFAAGIYPSFALNLGVGQALTGSYADLAGASMSLSPVVASYVYLVTYVDFTAVSNSNGGGGGSAVCDGQILLDGGAAGSISGVASTQNSTSGASFTVRGAGVGLARLVLSAGSHTVKLQAKVTTGGAGGSGTAGVSGLAAVMIAQ